MKHLFINGKAGTSVWWRQYGVLFNPSALWIGGHYSPHHKRWCINLVPCLTVWVTKPGGTAP